MYVYVHVHVCYYNMYLYLFISQDDPSQHKDFVPAFITILSQVVSCILLSEFNYHGVPALCTCVSIMYTCIYSYMHQRIL